MYVQGKLTRDNVGSTVFLTVAEPSSTHLWCGSLGHRHFCTVVRHASNDVQFLIACTNTLLSVIGSEKNLEHRGQIGGYGHASKSSPAFSKQAQGFLPFEDILLTKKPYVHNLLRGCTVNHPSKARPIFNTPVRFV